jgi:hypothetical protein
MNDKCIALKQKLDEAQAIINEMMVGEKKPKLDKEKYLNMSDEERLAEDKKVLEEGEEKPEEEEKE